MKCKDVKTRLSQLVDRETTSNETADLELHLSECISCSKKIAEWKTNSKRMRATLPIAAPTSLDNVVLDAFRKFRSDEHEETEQKIGWFHGPAFAYGAGVFCLAIVALLSFQMGKFYASDISVGLPQTGVLPAHAEFIKESVDPKVKIVEVPVFRQHTVTKVIYRNRSSSARVSRTKPSNKTIEAATVSQGFQMVSVIKPRIIKKGESDE